MDALSAPSVHKPVHFRSFPVATTNRVTITLEGGGLTCLLYLGHLHYLFREKKWVPLAFSGASAGALLASLLWVGLNPEQIRDKIAARSGRFLGLTRYLWKDLRQPRYWGRFLWNFCARLPLFLVYVVCYTAQWPVHGIRSLFVRFPDPDAEKIKTPKWNPPELDFRLIGNGLSELIESLINDGLDQSGLNGTLRTFAKSERKYLRFDDVETIVKLLEIARGVEGESNHLVQYLIQQKLLNPDKINGLKYADPSLGTDSNLLKQLLGPNTATSAYFPPLFIVVADRKTGKPVVVDNVSGDFRGVPIAKIVRASAGHPLLFMDSELTFTDRQGRPKPIIATDGGIYKNFPTTAVGDELHSRLVSNEKYCDITRLPHVCLGLRWTWRKDEGVKTPKKSGGANDADELARRQPHYVEIKQQRPKGAPHFLNTIGATPAAINRYFELGVEHCKQLCENMSDIFALNGDDWVKIEHEMTEALKHIRDTWKYDPQKSFARIHLYLDTGEQYGAKMQKAATACLDRSIDLFADNELTLGTRYQGSVGKCMYYRRRVVARVDLIQQFRRQNPTVAYDGLTIAEAGAFPSDCTLLFAVPVFDRSRGMTSQDGNRAHPDAKGWTAVVSSNRQPGPTFGVLAIDLAVPPDMYGLTSGAEAAGVVVATQLAELGQSRSTWNELENRSMQIGDVMAAAIERNLEPLRREQP